MWRGGGGRHRNEQFSCSFLSIAAYSNTLSLGDLSKSADFRL